MTHKTEQKKTNLTRQQAEKLWCACSDLLQVIDSQPIGSVKYQKKTFQTSETYKYAVTVLQKSELQLFGEIKTQPLTNFSDLSTTN